MEATLAAGRRRVAEMDADDRARGEAAPCEQDFLTFLLTIYFAAEAGVRGGDWSCVADAMAMLEQAMAAVERGGLNRDQ